MTMKVKAGTPAEDIDMFCKRASRVTLAQIVEGVVVKEQLRVQGQSRRTQFTVDLNFFPRKEYQDEHDVTPEEILDIFTARFPLLLKKELMNELKRLDADLKGQIAEIGKGKTVRRADGGDGDEDDEGAGGKRGGGDDDDSDGEGDADGAKRSRQKKQQASYESDSDEDDGEAFNDAEIEAAFEDDDAADSGAKGSEEKLSKKQANFAQSVKKAADYFQGHLAYATAFDFDESKCTFQLEVEKFCLFLCERHSHARTSVPTGRPQTPLCWYRRANLPSGDHPRNPWNYRVFPEQGGWEEGARTSDQGASTCVSKKRVRS